MGSLVKGDEHPGISPEDIVKYSVQEGNDEEKGVPDFWSKVVVNAKFFTVNERDEGILANLVDVRMKLFEGCEDFTLEFEFKTNDSLTDNILSKTYKIDSKSGMVEKTTGCQIHWTSEDKNPRIKKTVKNIKKGKKI